MADAPAGTVAVLATADGHASTVPARAASPIARSFVPMNGLLALSARPAGVMAVTTLSALLSRIPGSTRVDFGDYLRDLCDDHAKTFARTGDLRLTCMAAEAALPIGTVVTLGLVADLLIANAFVHALPPGSGGHMTVSFAAGQEAWQLVVAGSGAALCADGGRGDDALTIARLLVSRLDGRLETPGVTGRTHCIVTTIPRARA